MSSNGTLLPILGWKERVDFPEWGLYRLRAKVDTGARTSALHVARYELDTTGTSPSATLWLDIDPRLGEPLRVVTPLVRMTVVRSSSGVRERRPVIRTVTRLGPYQLLVEFTLTNRARMRHRIILGRLALAGRFTIDPGQTYLLPRPPRPRMSQD